MSPGLVAFAFAAAFTGGALYLNLVEQPARLALDDRAMISEWRPSDRRGFALLGLLAVVSAAAGLIAFHDNGNVQWLVGAIIVIASWPYTFFVVVPVNNRLLAASASEAQPDSRELVRDWGLLEWGLAAIGVVSTGAFGWAMS